MGIVLASKIVPADGRGTAAHRITLSETGGTLQPWVTHFQNCEYFKTHGRESGKCWGHYFEDWDKAVADYNKRIEEL